MYICVYSVITLYFSYMKVILGKSVQCLFVKSLAAP